MEEGVVHEQKMPISYWQLEFFYSCYSKGLNPNISILLFATIKFKFMLALHPTHYFHQSYQQTLPSALLPLLKKFPEL